MSDITEQIIDLKLLLIRYLKGQLVDEPFEELKDTIKKMRRIEPFYLQKCKTFEILWDHLEQRHLIRDGDYEFLKKCFRGMDQQEWIDEVKKYEDKMKSIRDNDNVNQVVSSHSQPAGGDHASSASRPSSQQPAQETQDLPSYKMNSVPRGLCIIINNVEFYQRSGGVLLAKREGSDNDAAKLNTLFTKLQFIVEIHRNLSSFDIIEKAVKKVASTDHEKYDCLVFCILSHGSKGCIFGADGYPVEVATITDHFKGINCRTLGGKPKLFFIQACQGSDRQTGFRTVMARDGVNVDMAQLLTTDGPNDTPVAAHPNTADFLIGYSTVPEYASFRNTVNGSWYMGKLVEMLDKYCDSHDLMSIMIEINKGVAEMGNSVTKQMPAPFVSLRKKVYLKSY